MGDHNYKRSVLSECGFCIFRFCKTDLCKHVSLFNLTLLSQAQITEIYVVTTRKRIIAL